MIVVFVQRHGFECYLCKERLDPWRELALVVPILCMVVSFELKMSIDVIVTLGYGSFQLVYR